ncbi:MAG: META domain-containing protein [Treponema sp.]|nr:META domain-containing protein [Treponema sp.]
MKKYLFVFTLIAACLIGCTTAKAATGDSVGVAENQDFSEIAGKDWKLTAVYVDGADIQFNRDSQPDGFSRDIFSLKFDDGTLSGLGAPNRFTGRYTLNEDQSLSVMPLASTMMAALFQPEGLSEFEFFGFLHGIYSWKQVNGNLELSSKTGDNREVRLVFGL